MSPHAGPLTWSPGAVVAATGKASAAVATIRNAISRKCFISGGPFSGELEVGRPDASVSECQEQDVAARGRGRLPVVDVLPGAGVVAERGAAGGGRLERVGRRRPAGCAAELEALDRPEVGNARAVLRQRPLDGIRLAGLADVDRRRAVDRLQESGEAVVDDVEGGRRRRRVSVRVGPAELDDVI